MRFVTVLSVVLLVGVTFGAALADKTGPVEKPWSYGPMDYRADVPEQEPNDACPGQGISCGDRVIPASYYVSSDDDWYTFHATAGTLVTIGTDSYNGSSVDTYLELYAPDCVTRLTYDDDGGPGTFSLISNFTLPADGDYHIKTFSYGHYYTGDYLLFTQCGVPNPPDPNDTCNPDYFLTRCTEGVINGDMTWDNNDYDPGSGGCATGYPEAGRDVAYKIDLVAGDIVDMTYYTPGFDAAFYVITDCANPAGSCVIGADAAGDTEVIHWVVGATGTYWIILDHYGTNMGAGPWQLTYNFQCPGPTGACCIDGRCTITAPGACQGEYMGDGTDCDPNPCVIPTEETSWGQIKSNYR